MKNEKGFTMIELLAVATILGVLVLIAVGGVSKYLTYSQNEVYKNYESNLKVASENYLLEHTGLIPKEGDTYKIELDTLISEQYSSELIDPENEKKMCTGYVIVKNDSNGQTHNIDLNYDVCLICSRYQTNDSCMSGRNE